MNKRHRPARPYDENCGRRSSSGYRGKARDLKHTSDKNCNKHRHADDVDFYGAIPSVWGEEEWKLMETSATPEGTAMELMQNGRELAIFVNGMELMASGQHGSEELMACMSLYLHQYPESLCNGGLRNIASEAFVPSWNKNKVPCCNEPLDILIGGLGLGYTLRAALDCTGSSSHVCVAELMECVIRWNQGILGRLADYPLRDERTRIMPGDVRNAAVSADWDIIMLDVDNGPSPVSQESNVELYGNDGISMFMEHLRPGGILAVWSVCPDKNFIGRMQHLGLLCRSFEVPAILGTKDCDRHTLFFALKND